MKKFFNVALLTFFVALNFAQASDSGKDFCPGNLPTSIVPDSNQNLKVAYHAMGFQIYTCTAQTDGTYQWVFTAPQAKLYSDDGELKATHFAGPTWKAKDGSTVVGKKIASANARELNSIPWLLLQATSHTGLGLFTNVTFIQRLSTAGGIAPSNGCDQAHVSQTASVPYTADYFFYFSRPNNPGNYQCK